MPNMTDDLDYAILQQLKLHRLSSMTDQELTDCIRYQVAQVIQREAFYDRYEREPSGT